MKPSRRIQEHRKEVLEVAAVLTALILIGIILVSDPVTAEDRFLILSLLAFLLAGVSIYLKRDALRAITEW